MDLKYRHCHLRCWVMVSWALAQSLSVWLSWKKRICLNNLRSRAPELACRNLTHWQHTSPLEYFRTATQDSRGSLQLFQIDSSSVFTSGVFHTHACILPCNWENVKTKLRYFFLKRKGTARMKKRSSIPWHRFSSKAKRYLGCYNRQDYPFLFIPIYFCTVFYVTMPFAIERDIYTTAHQWVALNIGCYVLQWMKKLCLG